MEGEVTDESIYIAEGTELESDSFDWADAIALDSLRHREPDRTCCRHGHPAENRSHLGRFPGWVGRPR